MLAAHYGQDPDAFRSRYRRPRLAELWKDYLAAHPDYPYDDLK